MESKAEKRSVKTSMTSEGNRLVGYAAVFNSPAQIFERGRTFTETIKPGSFKRAIESKVDVKSTFNHDENRLLGRTSSGTLRLSEDNTGLRFELDLPDTATGNEIRALVSRGDITGASFTFLPRSGGEVWDANNRTLTDVYLFELGPVIDPAYDQTSLALRSQQQMRFKKMFLTLQEKLNERG